MYRKHFADQNMNILDNIVGKKTSCLMIADGSYDEKIKREGLPNYQVEPPLDVFPVAETKLKVVPVYT